jgi:hypothetical protein
VLAHELLIISTSGTAPTVVLSTWLVGCCQLKHSMLYTLGVLGQCALKAADRVTRGL